MMAIRAIARHTFVDAMRSKVWIVIILYAALLALPTFVLPAATDRIRVQLVLSWALGNGLWSMLTLGGIVAILMASRQLWKDIVDRTIYTVITKPVSRVEMIVGRLAGYMVILLVIIIGMAVVTYGAIMYVARAVDYDPDSNTPYVLEADDPVEATIGRRIPESDVADDDSRLARRKYHVLSGMGPQRVEFRFLPPDLDPDSLAKGKNVRLKLRLVVNDPTKQDRPATEVTFTVTNDTTGAKEKTTLPVENGIDVYIPLSKELVKDAQALTVSIVRLNPKYTVAIVNKRCQLLAHAESFPVSFTKATILAYVSSVLLAVVALASSTVLEGFVCILWSVFIFFVGSTMDIIRETADVLSPGRLTFVGILQSQIDASTSFGKTIQGINNLIRYFLNGLTRIVPDFARFDTSTRLTENLSLSSDYFARPIFDAVVFSMVCLIIAFIAFRNREVGYK